MERLNVNPTRMMLTSLKKKLKTAVRGHKLLKDKRDELMKGFLELARETAKLRQEVEEGLVGVYRGISTASGTLTDVAIGQALMFPKQGVKLSVGNKNIMSVNVPVFDFTTTANDPSDIYSYGFNYTSGELDTALAHLAKVFPTMLELAAKEKEAALLAAELEKTRRRVNALEYVMIPQYQVTIKYITMKLDENERGSQTRLMKVKDMMLADSIEKKRQEDEKIFESYS